ncbi:MAG: hypothetical protein NZZ41_06705 [Candidatus Dojkabacteria bacterium]|nr:hypothetical protein [Candidatus Dojkabacteria bacterium]
MVKAKQNQALSANKVTAGKKSIINNKQLPVMQSPNLNYFQQALNISDEYLDSIKQQRDAALKASALDELRAA